LRYLITGGAGFIGSHLAERLLARGERVVLLDNLSTGSMDNIRHLKASGQMEYHLDNIENLQLLAELVDDADIIVHLAAAVGVKLIVESPVRTIETNVNGTQRILEAACKKRKLVLTASTSEVYGKNTNVPFHEDADLVLGPTTKGRVHFSRHWAVAKSSIGIRQPLWRRAMMAAGRRPDAGVPQRPRPAPDAHASLLKLPPPQIIFCAATPAPGLRPLVWVNAP